MTVQYSAGNLPDFVAEHIVTTAKSVTDVDPRVTKEYLSAIITEIQPQTQTIGAALLNVTLIDPTWVVARSGICTRDEDGLLPQVDVEYPPGTDVWWRLAYVGNSNDLTGANLTLTFRHRIVDYATHDFGPLGWKNLGGEGTTRAQFIKRLFGRIPKALPKKVLGPGSTDIIFVSPELNQVQPIAGTNQAGTVITIDQSSGTTAAQQQTAAQQRAALKAAGITLSSKVRVLGGTPTALQVANINAILEVGAQLNAPKNALIAAIYAAMGESAIGQDPTTFIAGDNGGSVGVFQAQAPHYDNGHDIAGEAKGFFTGGVDFGNGGAIVLAKAGHPPAQIANACEVNAVYIASGGDSANPNGTGDSYAHQWAGGQAEGIAEATKIVEAAGMGGLVSDAGSDTGPAKSDIAELSRGTPDLPDEDTWTCAQRLASEVNWLLFTSPYEGGRWGNFVYYIDGPTCVHQQPALYLELNDAGTDWTLTNGQGGSATMENKPRTDGGVMGLNGSVDNTSFTYVETLPVKGKTKRKSTLRMPQSPTQIKFNCFAGVFEFNAGQVAVFHNSGLYDGRWIIADATQNSLGDLFVQFTLAPPTYPYPEPQAAAAASSSTSTTVSAASVDGYVNPLSKLQDLVPQRVDQGVDYAGSGPLLAIGNGVVVYATNSDGGWPPYPGGAVTYQLSDGVYAGKYIYYTENLTVRQDLIDAVAAGQKPVIKAGDTLATLHNAAPNCEIGWASGANSTPLAGVLGQNGVETGQTPDDPGKVQSAAGRNFNELLKALGAPSGTTNQPLSTGPGMPAGWPSLKAGAITTPKTPAVPTASAPSDPTLKSGVTSASQGLAKGTAKVLGGIFGSVFDR